MTLLLDTHVLLWLINSPERISDTASRALRSRENELVVSAASLWETALKIESGKLDVPMTSDYVDGHMSDIGISRVLDISPTHIYTMLSIPRIHSDPFDRLLAAQSISENMRLVTADRIFKKYPVNVLW